MFGQGDQGGSVSVSSIPTDRELILDFTVTVKDGDRAPSEARVLHALAPAIRSALEAGWDPESRGRAFRHEIPDSI